MQMVRNAVTAFTVWAAPAEQPVVPAQPPTIIRHEVNSASDQKTDGAPLPMPPVIININNSPQPIFNNANTSNNLNQASAENKNINSNTSHLYATLSSRIKNIPYDQIQQNTASFLKNNRTALLWGTAISSYTALSSYLISTNYTITHAIWSNWKKHITNNQLHEILLDDMQKKELSKELILTIFKQYINPIEPTNNIKPLIDFMRIIDQEIATSNRFIVIGQFLIKSRLSIVLPINQRTIITAKKCKNRARIVKNIFLSWLASCNIHNLFDPHNPTHIQRVTRSLIDLEKTE